MEIKNYFSFYSEPIPVENIVLLTEDILNDLYAASSEVDQLNIFFHLQNEYFFLKNAEKVSETAYLCYIISYYIFTALTPPHSEELALEYIKEAIRLEPKEEYRDWLEIVKKGN